MTPLSPSQIYALESNTQPHDARELPRQRLFAFMLTFETVPIEQVICAVVVKCCGCSQSVIYLPSGRVDINSSFD